MLLRYLLYLLLGCHNDFMSYSAISIIYNPNSTGDSAKNADRLKTYLAKLYPNTEVKLQKTKYAGHAEKLAYDLSLNSKRPLIISSSGDGGYNEVINGAVMAQLEGAKPICAVMASGNANDHSRTLQDATLIEAIKAEKVRHIDLLKIEIKNKNNSIERYAHSYIGLGLTPVVAVELNKTNLNALNELWIVLRTFYKYRPFKIKHEDTILKLDSIIFANISEMAKVLTISKFSKPDDGLFEVVSFRHGHKLKLLKKIVEATINGLEAPIQTKSYEFTVLRTMPAQLDGEVVRIRQKSLVKITSEHKVLRTVL
jgi:diacylglycerol kinase (ATP)